MPLICAGTSSPVLQPKYSNYSYFTPQGMAARGHLNHRKLPWHSGVHTSAGTSIAS